MTAAVLIIGLGSLLVASAAVGVAYLIAARRRRRGRGQ